VAALIERGLLDVRPGIGTVVSAERPASSADRRAILDEEAERLVVEAKRAGLSLQDVIASVRAHWTRAVRRVG
jgi:GntR family transcriptional regulator